MDLANTGLQPALCEHKLPFKQPPMPLHPFLSIIQKTRIYKSFQVTEKGSRCRKHLEAKGES